MGVHHEELIANPLFEDAMGSGTGSGGTAHVGEVIDQDVDRIVEGFRSLPDALRAAALQKILHDTGFLITWTDECAKKGDLQLPHALQNDLANTTGEVRGAVLVADSEYNAIDMTWKA